MKSYLSKPWGARILVAHLALIGWFTGFGLSSQAVNPAQAQATDQTVTAPAVSGDQIISLTNQTREVQGLGTLTYSAKLARSAQMKADDMAAKSYFAHENPEGHRL